ncbi:MAG: hypothetical protein PSX80_07170 [bacterium]|nr:hypothetical protein [bacterium]
MRSRQIEDAEAVLVDASANSLTKSTIITLFAAGAVTVMRLGNWKWENTAFNSRMQPTQIGLGNGVKSQNLLKLEYEYGATASVNNGNVTKQTIIVPGVAQPFVQTYAYDELNRITNAEEIKNAVQQWEQTFTYDRFGNRKFDQAKRPFAVFDKAFGSFWLRVYLCNFVA